MVQTTSLLHWYRLVLVVQVVTGACGTVVGLMVASPGRREMEGTNDCTVGRRERPKARHCT